MYKYTQPSLNVYTSPSLSGYSPTTDYGGVAMRPSQSHSSTSSYESKQSSCLQDYSSPASSLEEYPENQFGNDIELNFEFAGSKQRGKSDKYVSIPHIQFTLHSPLPDILLTSVQPLSTTAFLLVATILANENSI